MSRHLHSGRAGVRDHAATPVPGTVRGARGGGRGRRHAPFAKGDLAALVAGATLVLCVLALFSWSMAQYVAEDRAVAAGQAPAPHVH